MVFLLQQAQVKWLDPKKLLLKKNKDTKLTRLAFASLPQDLCGGQPEHLSMNDAKAVINDLLMLKRGAGSLLFDDAGKAYVQKESE